MILSIIIPTRNEAANIVRCISAFDANRQSGKVEVIVVDNASIDDTQSLARRCGATVFAQGPERCAQRNRGWREAHAAWVMFVDADMEVPPATQDEILSRIASAADTGTVALYVRETRTGTGFRMRYRNFERSFYDATCIDGLRVFRRDALARLEGYDTSLTACEDWDLDLRMIAAYGEKALSLTSHALLHHEENTPLLKMLTKKRYYAQTMDRYRAKWPAHPRVARQFSPVYRYFGVFLESGKWRRVVRHPLLFTGLFMERILVGLVWILKKG